MRGVTLLEMMIVLVLVGLIAVIAVPPLGRSLDRAAVVEGAERYGAVHETARALAIARGRQSRVELDPARHEAVTSLRVGSGAQWDTVDARSLGRASFTASRVIIVFSPIGVGFGASNTSVIFTAGLAAETLTVSRTGRLRRY
jgi:prepilin-type N-terminal cleavage/methylation domain-containing protein